MKSNELEAPYETPVLNVTAVSVENGFADSGLSAIDELSEHDYGTYYSEKP